MKGYIEERAIELANYIVEKKTTVRAAAKKFGISKSTVHMEVTNMKVKITSIWSGNTQLSFKLNEEVHSI